MFDYINGQRFAEMCGQQWGDRRIGPGSLVYCLSHEVKNNLAELERRGPTVLVTHCSDMSITDADVDALPSNVKAWFGTNMESTRPRAFGIPIGFCNRSDLPAACAWEVTPPRFQLVYMCHTHHPQATLPPIATERRWMYEYFRTRPWVKVAGGNHHGDVPFATYMHELKSSHFVFSPWGSGPDCHRTWEALAAGCIPIIKRHPALRWFEAAPILWVDSWFDVSLELLTRAKIQAVEAFPTPLVEFDYWARKIKCVL